MAYLNNIIKANRRQIDIDLQDSAKRPYFSSVYYGQYKITLPLMKQYAKGNLLDLGCGDLPFKSELEGFVSRYDSLDFFPRNDDLTYVADIQNMPIVPDEGYDSAICLEVLEHVPDPFRAAQEIYRVLKPGGVLIATVPHLSRLHDVPYDYYRYTKYGLQYLLAQAGFEVVELVERGGIFSFLGHQISNALLSLTWSVPLLKDVVWYCNRWLITQLSFELDKIFDRPDIFALGYTVVAIKPDAKSYNLNTMEIR